MPDLSSIKIPNGSTVLELVANMYTHLDFLAKYAELAGYQYIEPVMREELNEIVERIEKKAELELDDLRELEKLIAQYRDEILSGTVRAEKQLADLRRRLAEE